MEYKEHHRIYMKEYYWRNREMCLQKAKEYRDLHRDEINKKARQKYKEKVLQIKNDT